MSAPEACLATAGVIPKPMIDRIKALFEARDGRGSEPDGAHSDDELHLAAAALMVEAALMDESFDAAEREAVATVLRRQFNLDAEECRSLMERAEKMVHEANHLLGFTRIVKDRFPPEERVRLIEMLWEVAYADGVLHDYEESLLRRVAGLIYVSDRQRGEARKRVMARLGLA